MYSSAKKLQRVLSAGEIRKTFIDYFIEHDHKFVRSSPVVPFCDPTVSFVNSGMNQFKSVFLGKAQAPYPRVVNSQKCVRVGGKHNDLDVVGQDGYHHTFFEMLGNWSFGDYFKRHACELALNLLRGPYNIKINRLYVTYFAGDKALGLPADLECFEIWRSLGFPAHKILPFGCKDNFWEMGSTGPCGPCTEIHYDHHPELADSQIRAKFVNAGRADLTELWNLVFIQYQRDATGNILELPARHVDTGMGFERLTALLQQKTSNYDTDLFTPIFDIIQSTTGTPAYSGKFPTNATGLQDATLDTGYRILADHARMVAVCLADGMLPDQNQKLRRVLRKAFKLSEQLFRHEKLLPTLIPVVADILGTAYPELHTRQRQVLELLAHEHEVYKSVRDNSAKAFNDILAEFPSLQNIELMDYPGLLPAYRDFQSQKSNFKDHIIPGKFLFKLADTYGLTEETFQKLAELEQMSCDLAGYREEVSSAKLRSKNSLLTSSTNEALLTLTQQLPPTCDAYKYNYAYDVKAKCYVLPSLHAKVLGMLVNEQAVETLEINELPTLDATISIVTDMSNFYYEAGGQQSDMGRILCGMGQHQKPKLALHVLDVKLLNDCIVHVCKVDAATAANASLQTGDEVLLEVDAVRRQGLMCHHTATHLLNGAIRTLFQKVTYQVSSAVSSDHCRLEIGLIGKRLDKDDVERIEDLIGRVICAAQPVHISTTNAATVFQSDNDITMIPGEIYPETDLRLITIESEEPKLLSKELCCGTHITNTQELDNFCITNCKLTNRARYAFTAVAGKHAEQVLKTAALLKRRVDLLDEQCATDKLTNATEIELQQLRNQILHTPGLVLPYSMRLNTLERINELLKSIKEATRTKLSEFVDVEMKSLLQDKPQEKHAFLVHYICSSALVEEIPLQRATKHCTDRPILVVVMCDGFVRARCCVPQKFITANFDAEKWLQEFANVFKAKIIRQKGNDNSKACNMKSKKIIITQFEEQLEVAITKANEFAKKNM